MARISPLFDAWGVIYDAAKRLPTEELKLGYRFSKTYTFPLGSEELSMSVSFVLIRVHPCPSVAQN